MMETLTVNHDAMTWDSVIGPALPPPAPVVTPEPEEGIETSAGPVEPCLEAEQGLLGAILFDDVAAWPAVEACGLKGRDFYLPAHRSVFEAIRALHKAGRPVDLVTVSEEVHRRGLTDKIGGVTALDRLVDACATPAYAPAYARSVAEAAQRRRLAHAANQWAEAASKGTLGKDLLGEIRKVLDREAKGQETGEVSPEIRTLGAFALPPRHDAQELLKSRFLCRGGALLLVGPTGIGKSSFVMQGAIRWALGQEFFGIQAAGPMRVLMVQAENDDGDIAEMRDGVYRGLQASGQLSKDDPAVLADRIAVVCEDSRTGRDFGASLDRLLGQWKPDLVMIDPALAYLGGDALKQADVTLFCRNILNPLIHRHQCGLILVHHTNKPPRGEEKSDWKAGDLAYLGQGAADWANWARAVVAIRAKGSHSVYELCLGKRGRRAGWTDKEGKPLFVKDIAHAREPGTICWRVPDDAEVLDAHPTPGPARKDWRKACQEAVEIAQECVRTKSSLQQECIQRIPDVGDAEKYKRYISPAIAAAKDDGKLEWATTHDGVSVVHLVGPADGSVTKRVDEIEKTREAKKQRELAP